MWRLLSLSATSAASPAAAPEAPPAETITFPATFAFGTATAAYQIEGAYQEGGRGLTIWDAFTHSSGKVHTGETGDVAADHYHRFRSDVQLMAQMKLKYYRFSIAWSRILPNGYGRVNEEGVRFYSQLIDECIANGIHPVVTLYHWDLPLNLQLEYDGWLTETTASAFVQYAALCFARFGDRVKHWITFNEPANHAVYGWGRGEHAPGRSRRPNREPYLAGHYMLLAHAYAAARYRSEFQPEQRGLISIALNSDWREPASDAPADVAAAQRSMDFGLGWFAEPLYMGNYPASMRSRVGNRLPAFTPAQQQLLLNSTDFFALQHYATMVVSERPRGESDPPDPNSFYADEGVRYHSTPGARKNMLGWDIAPFGFHRLLKWVHTRYKPPGGIVVTENGLPLAEDTAHAARRDMARVCYLKQYLASLAKAMREGADVRGYFYWSLLDNFEWAQGTAPRFGLLHVDFTTQRRTAKGSAAFYAHLSESHTFTLAPGECNATLPVQSTFASEAAQLQRLVNKTAEHRQTSGQPAGPQLRKAIVGRGVRLAAIAEMQARYHAEQGDFRLMRVWQGKGEKMRTFADKQKVLLVRALQAAAASSQPNGQPAGAAAATGAVDATDTPPPPLDEQPREAEAGGGADAAAARQADPALGLPEVQTETIATDPALYGDEASTLQTVAVDAAPLDAEESV